MFKWPGTPSVRAPAHEVGDFAELVCWRDNGTSVTALSQDISRLEDNDYAGGVPEEDPQVGEVHEAYGEIEKREKACREGYPFVVGDQGYSLYVDHAPANRRYIIYKYLLLATRLDMGTNRLHAGIDGTLLFEELAAEVAREYFGNRAESLVFGTAAGMPSFPHKVNNLCKRLKEGGRFEKYFETSSNPKDGKLDVVVWKRFTDGKAGKLIAFGQCKTGTNYEDALTHMRPDSFCANWMHSPIPLTPVRMFFVAEALPEDRWHKTVDEGGLLFDRCRIVDFSDNINKKVLDRVKTWTNAAWASCRFG